MDFLEKFKIEESMIGRRLSPCIASFYASTSWVHRLLFILTPSGAAVAPSLRDSAFSAVHGFRRSWYSIGWKRDGASRLRSPQAVGRLGIYGRKVELLTNCAGLYHAQ